MSNKPPRLISSTHHIKETICDNMKYIHETE